MWLKVLGCVVFPSIIAWLIRIFWPQIWTTEIRSLMTCHSYAEQGPGCRPICPLGYFHLPTMDERCHPWLTCPDLRNGIVKVKVIGSGAVKQVSLATWKGHKVAMNEPITELYLKDYRYGLDILKQLQGHLEVIQFVGSCNDMYLTQFHKFAADQIENIIGDEHKDNIVTRFVLCMNYVAILNFLHKQKTGTLVMCDSNDLEKTLKQYLVTDDLTLVLNDVDSLAKVNHSEGQLIKCGHRQLGGEFVAPEQLWPYDEEFTDEMMPPYDEKSDIWKIPDVCNNFLNGHSDAMKIKLDLFGIHSACKEEQPSLRPTAEKVLREYEQVWKNIKRK